MVKRAIRRQRPSQRLSASLGMAVALSVLLAGCSGESGDDPGAACPAPSPAPPAQTGLMPAGLSFDKIGTVTQVRSTERDVTVEAVTTKALDEVTVLIQDAVTAAGYRPAGIEDEGSEAEVFFTTGSYAAGQARVRQAECEGQWDIELVLLDPDAVPSPSASTTP